MSIRPTAPRAAVTSSASLRLQPLAQPERLGVESLHLAQVFLGRLDHALQARQVAEKLGALLESR